MVLNRREFLKGSGAVWGTAVLGAGLSTLTARGGSVAEAAGPAPMYEIYALKYAGPFTGNWLMLSMEKDGMRISKSITIYGPLREKTSSLSWIQVVALRELSNGNYRPISTRWKSSPGSGSTGRM